VQTKGLGEILSEGTFHSYRGEYRSDLMPALPEDLRKVNRVYYVSHGGTFASRCERICSSAEKNLLASIPDRGWKGQTGFSIADGDCRRLTV